MRVLSDSPVASGWRLLRATAPDGTVRYYTGPCQGWDRTSFGQRARQAGMVLDEVPNVVAEARLLVDGWAFTDADTGARYAAAGHARARMLRAIADGRLRCRDGAATGLVTFAREAGSFSIVPWDGDAPAGDDASAPGCPKES